MKRIFLSLLAIFLLLGIISVADADFNLEVEKVDKGAIIISELNNPAIFDLIINNNGEADMSEIYSLVGVSMAPKGTFLIPAGRSQIEIRAYPNEQYRKREGSYSFGYEIRGQKQGIFKDKLSITVISLREALSVKDANIHPDDNSINIQIKNNAKANLENVEFYFRSAFFDDVKKIDFKPLEEVNVSIQIDKNKISKLVAGPYTMKVRANIEKARIEFEATINYLEKTGTSVSEESSGFLIRRISVTKVNRGNTSVKARIEMNKDIISRLFTTFSSDPLSVVRNGLFVNYVWEKSIGPDESFDVTATTNYTFPFLILILIIVIGFLVRKHTMTSLNVKKKVFFVKTKRDEFALRVVISVKARKKVSNIKVIDRLPIMTKLYEKFGRAPDKIDEATRRLIWNISHLNRGEERIFSYIIYSKVRTVGRFELPVAMVIFEKDGKHEEVSSNKAYFVSEVAGE